MGLFSDVERGEKDMGSHNFQLEEGKYLVVFEEGRIDLTKDPVLVSLHFNPIEDENGNSVKSRYLWMHSTLDGVPKKIFMQQIEKMGIDPDGVADIDDLGKKLETLEGKYFSVFLKKVPKKNKPGEFYENVYVNHPVENDNFDEPKGVDENEELPF